MSWDNIYTKRKVLAFINSVFDPLGLLSPVLIRGMEFLQTLWLNKWDWDSSFASRSKLKEEWDEIVQEILIACKATFKRRIVVNGHTQVHGFSDASGKAYGAVIYLRTPKCEECPGGNISLLMAKNRVVPLGSSLAKGYEKDKLSTTPKLELMGILLLSNLMDFCCKSLELPDTTERFMWSDSTTALSWLDSTDNKEVFVFNRVKSIRSISKGAEIRFVDTKRNPADIVTRKQIAKDFTQMAMW